MLDTAPRMKFWLSCNMRRMLCIVMGIVCLFSLLGCVADTTPDTETMPIPSEVIITDPTILETSVEENVEILETEVVENSTSEEVVVNTYISITGAEAKALMESEENYIILVYCRSGRRSKLASAVLAEMGYTNIKEFGGVIDWEYGLVTD